MKRFLTTLFAVTLLVGVALGGANKERDAKRAPGETIASGYVPALSPSSKWTPVAPWIGGQGITMINVAYSSASVVWAAGYTTPDYVFRSVDGGKSWAQHTVPDGNVGTTNIAARTDSTAIVGLFSGEILRTTDGGATWDTVMASYGHPAADAFMDGVAFMNADTAFAFGDADTSGIFIGRSTDGGATWTRLHATAFDSLKEGWYGYASYGSAIETYGRTIWIGAYHSGQNFHFVKSTDGGQTWNANAAVLTGGTTNYYLRSFHFLNDNIGFGVDRGYGGSSANQMYHRTTDGGLTWSDTISVEPGVAVANAKPYSVLPVRATGEVLAVGFSAATGSKTWWSTDSGQTFTALPTPGTTNLIGGAFFSGTNGVAVGYKSILDYTPSVLATIMVNTSGWPDTLKANSTVQLRGSDPYLTWDQYSTKMSNAGGDYWKTTIRLAAGDSMDYKFFTNPKATITGSDVGYEGGPGSQNHRLKVGNNDTTLALQYVNGFNASAAQFQPPYRDSTGYYVCYIRVNMSSYADFNPLIHKVGVRGSFPASNWGTSIIASPEGPLLDAGQIAYNPANFYKLAVYWPKTLIDTSVQGMTWKWVVHNINASPTEDWSLMVFNPNFQQSFNMPAHDTTVNWVWFNNTPFIAAAGHDTATFIFRTDLSAALGSNSIKPNDSVEVRFGYNGSAAAIATHLLKKQGFTNVFVDTAVVTGVAAGKQLYYQYYLAKNGQEFREVFYDFDYTGADASLNEKRKADVTAKNTTITVQDTARSITVMHRQPVWQNTNALSRNVVVRFSVNLRPAYYLLAAGDSLFDAQGSFRTIIPGDKDTLFTKLNVWMNGPAVGGWANPAGSDWGLALRQNTDKMLYDDGTHGDLVINDHIYTRMVTFYKDSVNNTIGQIFKFGIYGGDNEGGKGGYGNNHVANIDDSQDTTEIHSQFGSINPSYYGIGWNYDTESPTTDVRETPAAAPLTFTLSQNYPNPFNPSTQIRYTIAKSSHVTLRIYNLLGQEVATLVDAQQNPAQYEVSFNAARYASGVYFYRLDAGSFTSIRKMLLLK